MKRTFLLAFLFMKIFLLYAQKDTLQLLTHATNTNLRGLGIADKNIISVSGSNGMIGISTDGGNSWKWQQVKNFEQKDFRDIEVFDKNHILLMSIDTPAYILKTADGGNSWNTVYKNNTPGMFLDAMNFKGKKGIVVGDPVNGKIFLATSNNNGNYWESITTNFSNKINNGEAFFASSGSNIVLRKDGNFYLVSGGSHARLFTKNFVNTLPVMQGTGSTGANAVAVYKNHIAVCGGDFIHPFRNDSCLCFSDDEGKTWHTPVIPPNGYRSDIIYISDTLLYTCGLTGIDISEDGGKAWRSISKDPFNTCRFNQETNEVFFAGPHGSVAKLKL